MRLARPLARFALVDTCNLDETRAALARAYAPPALELVGRNRPFRAVVNGCRLQHIALNYGWYSAALRMQFPDSEFAAQIVAIEGQCEARTNGISTAIGPASGIVVSPGEPLTITNCSDGARMILVVNPVALANKLAALVGQSCSGPLKFNPVHDYTLPAARALRDHILFLVKTVSASAAPLPKPALDEFEQTLMVMFLHAHRHNYSHLLERVPPDPAPWQVRRAEEFIEANWRHAIGLEELAELTGVGAASLFRSFKKKHGCSPREFRSLIRSRCEETLR